MARAGTQSEQRPWGAAGTPAYGFLVAVFCLAWSSAFPVGKIALETCPPELFLAFRFLPTAAILLAWAGWRGELRRLSRRHWCGLLALGLLNQAGYNGLTWLGMRGVSSGLATVIISTNPILVGGLAALFLGEALTRRRILGLALGLAGVLLVVRHRIGIGEEDPLGVALVTGALLSLVLGTVIFKKWSPAVPLSVVVGVQALSSGTTLLIVALATESVTAIIPDGRFWFALVYIVFVVSILGFVLWFLLLSRGSATAASALHFLMPPLGLALAWVTLGERLDPLDFLGTVPIALGIWLVTHGGGSRVRSGAFAPARGAVGGRP